MVKINWTEISIDDLKEIYDFIASDSSRYASLLIRKIYHRASGLKMNPYICRMVPEFNEKDIRELIEGNYRIIYKIKSESQVDIVRIFHSSRMLKNDSVH